MRGKTAKRLRKIARQLELNPATTYAPGGPLRRGPDKGYTDDEGVFHRVPGAPIRRPGVLQECFRRAYQEAKQIYKGAPPTALEPEGDNKPAPFNVRMIEAVKKQGQGEFFSDPTVGKTEEDRRDDALLNRK